MRSASDVTRPSTPTVRNVESFNQWIQVVGGIDQKGTRGMSPTSVLHSAGKGLGAQSRDGRTIVSQRTVSQVKLTSRTSAFTTTDADARDIPSRRQGRADQRGYVRQSSK